MTTNLAAASIISTGSTTTRTLGARFSEIKNVKDYGAVGDGSHNDTSNIQAAVDAAIDAGGGTVYFPSGTYSVNAEITFTRNRVSTKGVKLVGERNGLQTGGSIITGSVNGYIFNQNDWQIETVTTVVGTFIIGERLTDVATSTLTTNPIIAKDITAGAGTITVTNGSAVYAGSTPINVKGVDSGATATVTAEVANNFQLNTVENLSINNTNTTVDTGAIRLEGLQTALVLGCWLRGMTGVRCGSNVAGCNIINTFCSGNGTVGSIGINGGCDMISGCNIIGWATGVRWAGSGGCALIGTRFEVCNTAIHTGIDAYGNSLSSQGLNITAIQCERCDTDVYWESTQGTIIGCLFTGIEAVAGGGAPRNYGIRVTSASSLLIAASIVVGNLSVAGVDLSGTGGQYSYVTCIGVSATVGSGGGVTWNLGYGAANTGVKLINCNAGFTPTFADLPATAFKGDRAFITNCNTTTFNNAAAGGGTNNVPVFYDGSAWKVG